MWRRDDWTYNNQITKHRGKVTVPCIMLGVNTSGYKVYGLCEKGGPLKVELKCKLSRPTAFLLRNKEIYILD